jgi:hypothetical protein
MSESRSPAGHRARTLDVGALALMLLAVAGCTTERPARLIAGLSDTVVVNTTRPVAILSTSSTPPDTCSGRSDHDFSGCRATACTSPTTVA